ncbi:hypothetical protein GBF73_04450 [Staphylococcus aureus]|nr:hypothetical protein [Staphylococcus aureus]
MKIAVMTDSTSYLSQDLIDKYNIQIAPLSVTFDDGKNFTESNEIAIEEFYNKMHRLKRFQQQANQQLANGLLNMKC